MIGKGSKIWHNSQVGEMAKIGKDVTVGSGAYIGPGVEVGSNSKIQNQALVYEPSLIGSGVFIGPGVIFTNDHNQRAINANGTKKLPSDWNPTGVTVEDGASIGAGAICIAPVRIGAWALVASGAVVTKDVSKFALVVGNPAKQIGWVGKHGHKLLQKDGILVCPVSNIEYVLEENQLVERAVN
jgi:acetyltransferase-like isoleucine patch superfamily enzyme